MKLDDLKRDPNNARKRGDQAASTLAGSLAEFGAARSIVIDADGIIRAGNGTVEAAKAAGITKAKIVKGKPDELIVVQRSDLKGEAAKAYAIADNRTSELAEWDIEELGSQLDSLTEFDPAALGFTEDDLGELFPPEEPEVEDIEPQIDRAEELQKEWSTETGQLWEIGRHRLLCGDSTKKEDVERLLEGNVSLVLTDPPFSAETHNNAKSNRIKGHGNKAIDFPAIDFPAIDFPAIRSFISHCGTFCDGWLISFLDDRHIAELRGATPEEWEFMRFGVWVKNNPMPQISADRPAKGWDGLVYLRNAISKPGWSGGGHHGNWISPVVTAGAHPTVKPIEFIAQLIDRFTGSDDHVYDPFLGSGTTMLAAEQLGRRCYGMEISPKYCAVILERMKTAGCDCKLEGE